MVMRTIDQILANLPLFASLAILASFASIVIRFFRSPSASAKIPRAAAGSLILGNAVEYGKNPVMYVREMSAKYGKLWQMKLLSTNVIWLRGTKLNKTYLETREDIWSFGDGMVSDGTFTSRK